jgi:hypothetical protein
MRLRRMLASSYCGGFGGLGPTVRAAGEGTDDEVFSRVSFSLGCRQSMNEATNAVVQRLD